MKNAFDGFINGLDTVKERISEAGDISIEFSKDEKQKEWRLKKKTQNLIYKDHGTNAKSVKCV